MKRALPFLLFLPALALAQPAPTGGTTCTKPSATCQSKHFLISTGGDLLPPSAAGASLGSTTKYFANVYAQTIVGTFATPQLIDMTSGSNGIKLRTGSTAGGDIRMADLSNNNFLHVQSTGLTQGSVENPVPVVHVAQTASPVAMEFGHSAASAGGALAVTFATAFASAPTCVCTDENAVPVTCGSTTAASTTAVTFSITLGRADTLDWICIGAK